MDPEGALMAYIELVDHTGAGDPGPNLVRAFGHRPAVLAAWQQLRDAVTETMDERLYELVTLAAARSLRSSYCSLAHGSVLLDGHLSVDELITFLGDPASAPLTPAELAAVRLARKVVEDAASVSAEDVDALRRHGFDDAEIFDVVAAAAMRCFLSKTLDGLGVQPDAEYLEWPANLRDALVTGRPIAPAREA
jgi:alkylhydroperoxidase family enzyme